MAADRRKIIESKNDLVEYLESGCKPRELWRVGTEHEKFAYRVKTLEPLRYDGENGIRAILEHLSAFGWEKVMEGDNLVALTHSDGGSITLEPAGQLELSGAPLETIHQTCEEVSTHLNLAKQVAASLGIGFLGLGYHPKYPPEQVHWMPKRRYEIMKRYMPTKGALGLDMMVNTCTAQVNLDFCSEATMREMFRVSLALQPIATAIWANSPFKDGKPSGYLSYRSHVWEDTDPDRCGNLPFVFEDGFGFERYVDYMLDVPMYFVHRNGVYVDVAGQSFRDFMDGRLPGFEGRKPTIKDWEDHLSTAFPEVRLKKYLELRGADGGPWNRLCALPAFWVGLLYDDEARRGACDIIRDWSREERDYLRAEAHKTALRTPFGNTTVRDIAVRVLKLAHGGLKRRAREDWLGLDETHFLNPLFRIAESGFTPADDLLAAYRDRWNQSVDPVFREYAY